jgi:hypothetical protein
MRDHQLGHVDDRNRIRCAELPRRKSDLDGVIVIEEEVAHSHEIEGDDEQPEDRLVGAHES